MNKQLIVQKLFKLQQDIIDLQAIVMNDSVEYVGRPESKKPFQLPAKTGETKGRGRPPTKAYEVYRTLWKHNKNAVIEMPDMMNNLQGIITASRLQPMLYKYENQLWKKVARGQWSLIPNAI